MTELHDLTALQQAAAIRDGSIRSVELAEHYLRRSEALTPVVGAFASLTADLALRQARAADAAVRDGADGLGPLHGVVAPIKDLNTMAGVRVRFGSAAFDVLGDTDEDPVANLREGGLVCTGTTSAPEFGLPCYTENLIAPPARTPWDLTRSAGGSSGGAAAAVATGLAPLALGSDGGGSIRIPASATGLVGIKPGRGTVGSGPFGQSVGELVVQGPLARTVADAAAMLDVLAAPRHRDPDSPLPDGATSFLAAAQRAPGRLRIGRYRDPVIAQTDLDRDVLTAYESASALLAELGHEVVEVARPFGPDVVPQFEAVWSVLALLAPVAPEQEEQLMPLTRWLRAKGSQVTGLGLATAVGTMRALARAAILSVAHVDVVLCPTLAKLPAPVGGLRNDADPAADFEAQKRFTPFTSPYNISGQPSISVPLHWTAGGLPVGVQIVGRPRGESTIISLAAQIEQARPWMQRRHGLW